MKIDIVCPIYLPNEKVINLFDSFHYQKGVEIENIICPITISNQDAFFIDYCKKNNITYFLLEKKYFSHSFTREKCIRESCKNSIVILLSQDVEFVDEYTLFNLAKSIESNECVYAYSRQISLTKGIERYTREYNYLEESKLYEPGDISFSSLFASDACSALNREVFLSLGGYQGINALMNEDQLYSYIVLSNGYKKKYAADSIVIHSHNYTLKSLYKRYYLSGKANKEMPYNKLIKTTLSGKKLFSYCFKRALKEKDIKSLFLLIPNFTARYLGYKKGSKAK